MRRCPNLVRGKRILELGSGTGVSGSYCQSLNLKMLKAYFYFVLHVAQIVGICAGYAGASFAVLSDASVSDLLRANAGAAARACGPVFETIEYCWCALFIYYIANYSCYAYKSGATTYRD
jgi:hypothetical protein